jgi:monoamine oxidase
MPTRAKYSTLFAPSSALCSSNLTQVHQVSLQFRTRFWEKLPKPIYGGCGSTDIPYVGSFCYPSFNINGTGPGVILASYDSSDSSYRAVSLSEKAHVQRILDAVVEIHGSIAAREYTGRYVVASLPLPDAVYAC